MADLRIVDAPVLLQESITDDVKMPTGGLGNFSVRLGDILWYVITKEQLANKSYVDLSSKGVKDSLDVHIADKANPHNVTKAQVGLGNVDNTADIDKPVSNAVSSAITTATNDMATKAYVNSKDGDLTTLTTTDKTNLVKAINEVVSVKADKATKLVGYGISDAYTKSEIDTNYGDVKTLYDKNVAAGAGVNGWDANLVAYGETTQKQINDGLESIATMLAIKNPRNGQRVYVKSYHAGLSKGGGFFVYDSTKASTNDNGLVISGWVRQDVKEIAPELFGAKGDNYSNDTVAVQGAINSASNGIRLISKYVINDTLIIDGKHNFSVLGIGRNSWIRNIGSGKDALYVKKAEGCSFNDFAIIGDGTGFYSPTATTGHGINFENASLFTMSGMIIKAHGGHGIYINKGGWGCCLVNCKINFNKLDGINSLSEDNGVGSFYQNGNNLTLTNVEFNGNGQNAVHWKALALNVSGCIIERSGASGIFIDNSAYAVSTWGINIVGNYFEANKDNCIRMLSAINSIIDGVNIAGNFFSGGAPFPTSGTYIKFEGVWTGVRNTAISANTMIQDGSNVFIDGGNTLDKSVRIETTHPTKDTLFAKVETGTKVLIVSGALAQKTIPWSSLTGDSDNFFSSTAPTTIYFKLPVDSANVLHNLSYTINTDATKAYSVTSSLVLINNTTGAEVAIHNNTRTANSGGNLAISQDTSRKITSDAYFLKVSIPAFTSGSYAKITNLTMSFN